MAKLIIDTWNPRFLGEHPIYWPFLTAASQFVASHDHWPNLSDYQHYLDSSETRIFAGLQNKLLVVPQSEKQPQFSDEYEPRIFLKGELQTRQNNWHDFFQVLVWKIFPKTKAAINQLHYQAMNDRLQSHRQQIRRSALENTLTQFDECGAIIISSDPELLQLIRQFDWQTLFWQQREHFQRHVKCIVFGHAIYEKALNPYIGMTSHSILLATTKDILQSETSELLEHIDKQVVKLFAPPSHIQSPQDLSPIPLLGIPGWHPDNGQKIFYENSAYFRPGRKYKKHPSS